LLPIIGRWFARCRFGTQRGETAGLGDDLIVDGVDVVDEMDRADVDAESVLP